MLTDILGIVIAFSVVMLLLSLMVTSLSQATQHTLRLRGRNLKYGIAAAINQASSTDVPQSRKFAAEVMNCNQIAPLGGSANPNSILAKVIGPEVTWVDPEQLKTALEETSDASSDGAQTVVDHFTRGNLPLKKRFAITMRMVSMLWALAIAIVFQVSAPALVEQLSVDRELRESIASRADEVIVFASGELEQIDNDSAVYEAVIQSMVHKYPELKRQFEELDSDTAWLGDLSEELADAIETNDRADAIVQEFEDALTDAYKEARDRALESVKSTANQLSIINITPFRFGPDFYKSINNWIGLVMTTILLSLGAPFWFNTLKTASSLRDLLQPLAPDGSDDASDSSQSDGKKKKKKEKKKNKSGGNADG